MNASTTSWVRLVCAALAAVVAVAAGSTRAGLTSGPASAPAGVPDAPGTVGTSPRAQVDVLDHVRANRRLLWLSGLRAPVGEQGKAELMRAIERVRSRRIRVVPPTPASPAPVSSRPACPTSGPATRPAEGEKARGITIRALARLRQLPARGVADPLALADALYLAGQEQAAYGFYEMALKAQAAEAKRAWILFQMANCRRRSDPASAEALYQRLLKEQGESLWASLASVQAKLLQWYQVNAPEALLDERPPRDGK